MVTLAGKDSPQTEPCAAPGGINQPFFFHSMESEAKFIVAEENVLLPQQMKNGHAADAGGRGRVIPDQRQYHVIQILFRG